MWLLGCFQPWVGRSCQRKFPLAAAPHLPLVTHPPIKTVLQCRSVCWQLALIVIPSPVTICSCTALTISSSTPCLFLHHHCHTFPSRIDDHHYITAIPNCHQELSWTQELLVAQSQARKRLSIRNIQTETANDSRDPRFHTLSHPAGLSVPASLSDITGHLFPDIDIEFTCEAKKKIVRAVVVTQPTHRDEAVGRDCTWVLPGGQG